MPACRRHQQCLEGGGRAAPVCLAHRGRELKEGRHGVLLVLGRRHFGARGGFQQRALRLGGLGGGGLRGRGGLTRQRLFEEGHAV